MPRDSEPTKLQAELAGRILRLAKDRAMPAGTHLTELELAADFKVSRTPVRAALKLLAERGYVDARPNRGYFLRRAVEQIDADDVQAAHDQQSGELYLAIARDRISNALPDYVSEADMLRRYGVGRPELVQVLSQLAQLGVVERNPGHGWTFLPSIDSPEAHEESYRLRLVLEPAAILEPKFHLDPAWIKRMRERHQAVLDRPWLDRSAIEFFEMNAEFHERIVAGSGNRFFLLAVQQQNKLRRFHNYNWTYGKERVVGSVHEHLEILDRLADADYEWAAHLMRRHLEKAAGLKPRFNGPPPNDPMG
jgi:DNA-binding GntR family transcriptional regulator